MSQRTEVMSWVRKHRIVAVVRSTTDQVRPVVDALLEGGVCCIEITFTVPKAPEVIAIVKRAYAGQVVLGAGTVTDTQRATEAIEAGARYLVAPNTNLDVIRLCAERDVAVMPGAFTPTEIAAAWHAGADCVKLFPAELGGIPYLKAVRAPLPEVPIMPTGGVDVANAAEWLKAGAVALGVGSNLVRKDALASGNYALITQTARQFVAAVASA
ncbi:MAG TPA: bifunctional 4-hydroxy-2-oxoglutarate aldolase/2-dehydro-3-deoxy-phosphogluconate aldolase [Planctomycetota bacterium]|nr:bifunctional 4-hydroxy-2-oxoglutarate aldolase/2-dehydro-3-deoxy-phosphogluconate aldolase [Planctomycetota bacterium]HRR78782.1 bifunctional 4-hydroxy-2-oxoglutarate aldolase/2-dehydro-3-deoxy-phosphogluconate aldolase [Planctomycetota bacterium]HRT96377.1 bifunctional 4-hydroxy-2-oxoglutarate aldolase/2-dehydro-3-deoxy-phosphogluconate aldolase [Planctomycetota bacterium]